MRHLTIGTAVLALLFAGVAPLKAQGVASSFDQLRVLVKPGDKITVVDSRSTAAAHCGEGALREPNPRPMNLDARRRA